MDAVAKYAVLETVKRVEEALARVVLPVNVGAAESTMLPVPVTAFERVTPPYVSALESVVCPETASVPVAVIFVPMISPATESIFHGDVVPIPTLLLDAINIEEVPTSEFVPLK